MYHPSQGHARVDNPTVLKKGSTQSCPAGVLRGLAGSVGSRVYVMGGEPGRPDTYPDAPR